MAVLSMLYGMHGAALTVDYSLFSSIRYSDNLAQDQVVPGTRGDLPSGRALTAGANFALATEPNATLATSIEAEFARNRYSLDELKPDDTKLLDASILYQPRTSNFKLRVLESLQQVASDRTAVRTINNTRDVNTISAIPSYFISVSDTSRITGEYRHSRIDDRDGGNSRHTNVATLSWQKEATAIFTWSVNVRKQRVEFIDFNTEFDQEEAFLSFEGRREATRFNLEAGRQKLVDGASESDDVYQKSLRFSLSREINSFSDLGMTYRQGYGDTLNVDLSNPLIQLSTNDQAAFIAGIAEEKTLDLDYSYNKRDLNFRFSVGARTLEDDLEGSNDTATVDEDRRSLSVNLTDRFARSNNNASSFGYALTYQSQKNQFHLTEEENKIGTVSLRLIYFPSPLIDTFIELSSRNASGSRGNFDEQSVMLGIRIAPRGRR